nr:hypothetical protein [Tanacetum cinerariifolium]
VWSLVDCPKGVRPIGTKWVLKNKKDERGIVIRNKAMLVAQGHTQKEGIDYDEVFAPVARIKAIRLFLAYASFIGFTLYQMDVKSAFMYGTIDEEVGTIDQTLFIRRQRGDFILVQVYVDDIIFGSSNAQLCREFKALMHEKFQMSAMGELNFFLGLQVLQKKDGIFLSQDKYVGDILKKFGYSDVRSSNTPMDKENPWGKDGTGKDVDLHLYRSMIGSLMYLTTSRPYIMFAVYACARYQVTPKECHLHAVKRIFRYLKGHPKLGLWYPKDSPVDLVAYSDSDYGGATQDRKSTSGGLSMSYETLSKEISTSILRLIQFCDYHNMVAILEKSEHNTDFHPIVDFVKASPLRQYTRRARIPQSYALSPVADEPASPMRDDSQGEACHTDSGFIADQDRATIAKSSTLPHDSAPRVTSPAAEEGKINRLKERVKTLEDNQGVIGARSGDDAPIKGRRIDEEEVATKRLSSDIEEVRLDKGEVAAERTKVPTGSGSIPTAGAEVPTDSDVVPTASLIFATATVVTPYRRRKGKEVMVESETPKKQKVQKQIDAQSQQRKSWTKKQKIDYYMAVIRNNLGWKVKDFKGMTFEDVKAKFNSVCKQMEDFIPMGSKEEAERIKRKGINLEQKSAKKQKSSEEITEEAKSPKEVTKEKIKEMMQLVPIKEVYVEALQVKHPIIDWENLMHAPVEWKLYDSCGVHHVAAKYNEIFMLVEKDYPLRKGLALVMISYKLQLENYSQMAEDLIWKIYNIANSLR